MGSFSTTLAVQNMTSNSATATVSEVNSFDWDGSSRPDQNFNNVTISSLGTQKQHEEVNSAATSAWFRMTLTFTNGDVVTFRNDQYDARNGITPNPRPYILEGASAGSYLMQQFVDIQTATNTLIVFKR